MMRWIPVAALRRLALASIYCLLAGAATGGEPPPAATPAAPAADEVRPSVERIGGDEFRLGTIEFNRKSREIRFPARMNMNRGLLEYAIVHQGGKVHESLLVTDVRPFDLNVVILLCGFKPARAIVNPMMLPEARVPEDSPEAVRAASVAVSVRFPTPSGRDSGTAHAIPRPLASLVRNVYSGKPAAPGPWIYNGSLVEEGRFLAELDGSILALYLDHRAMINNPREGNFNDDIWSPAEGLPEPGTEVEVVLRPIPSTDE